MVNQGEERASRNFLPDSLVEIEEICEGLWLLLDLITPVDPSGVANIAEATASSFNDDVEQQWPVVASHTATVPLESPLNNSFGLLCVSVRTVIGA
jgi:hypothetical protein